MVATKNESSETILNKVINMVTKVKSWFLNFQICKKTKNLVTKSLFSNKFTGNLVTPPRRKGYRFILTKGHL